METFSSAGDTIIPAMVALRKMGYTVRRRFIMEAHEIWSATQDDTELVASDPVELLGLVKLREARGAEWHATNSEVDECLNVLEQGDFTLVP